MRVTRMLVMSPIIRLVSKDTVNKVAVKKVTKNKGGSQNVSGETKNTITLITIHNRTVIRRDVRKFRRYFIV